MARSTTTYALYKNSDGEPQSQQRDKKGPVVPGIIVDDLGDMYAPQPRWLVVARSAREAYWMAYNSETSNSRADQLGIWWDASQHTGDPAPLGADTRPGYALIAECDTPTMSWHESWEEAERAKERIDRTGCGGTCHGDHEITSMRADEAAWGADRRWLRIGGC